MTIARAQMNRQLYQLGGPIQEAESFYTNNLGMDPQEAMVLSKKQKASIQII